MLLGEASWGVEIDVLWPGGKEMERGFLGEFLNRERAREGATETQGRKWFSVLCFLGHTIEHLRSLRYVCIWYPHWRSG